MHEAPDPKSPYALVLPFFRLDFGSLDLLVTLENRAVKKVDNYTHTLMEPAMALVGPNGRPTEDAAQEMQRKVTDYLIALLPLPTLDEEWVAASTPSAKEATIIGTSFQIAYLVYQEFFRIMKIMAPEFVQISEMIMVSGLNAMHHGLDPVGAYLQGIKAQAVDNNGQVVVGQEAAFKEHMQQARNALLRFLAAKKLFTVAAGGAPPELTLDGVRLLKHLTAALASTECMKRQGPGIMKEVQADPAWAKLQGSDAVRTEKQIKKDLSQLDKMLTNPNAKFPEA